MKIFILLVFIYVGLLADATVKKDEVVSKSNITIEKKIDYVKVSDVPESAVSITVKLKKIEELIKDTPSVLDMRKKINLYIKTIITQNYSIFFAISQGNEKNLE